MRAPVYITGSLSLFFPWTDGRTCEHASACCGWQREGNKEPVWPWRAPTAPLLTGCPLRCPSWALGVLPGWRAARPRTWSRRPDPGRLIQGQASCLDDGGGGGGTCFASCRANRSRDSPALHQRRSKPMPRKANDPGHWPRAHSVRAPRSATESDRPAVRRSS